MEVRFVNGGWLLLGGEMTEEVGTPVGEMTGKVGTPVGGMIG